MNRTERIIWSALAVIAVLSFLALTYGPQAPSIPLPPLTNSNCGATNPSVLVIDRGGTNMLKITGTNAESLVLWSRAKPVVTKTHEGWTVRFGKRKPPGT